MRQSLQENATAEKLGTARAAHIAAPFGGWNTKDPLMDMPDTDAITLDNWYPRTTQIIQRGGDLDFATGMTGAVKSLAQWNQAASTKKLFAVTDSGIYDITAGGAIGSPVQALTNGYWLSVDFTNSAGTTFLWGANGVDTPKMYNGTAWSTPTVSGVTSGAASISAPWIFKHRIFFIEKNTMNMYFLAIDSIQGTASQFPLGNLFALGGYLVAGVNWTLDSGDGPDDLTAIVTSEGQLAVYQGTDPTSASAWSIIGVYTIGRPLGSRCFFKLAGDVGILTENGVFLLSKLLASGGVNASSAMSVKIQPSWTAAVAAGGILNQGWEGCVYPAFDALIINVLTPNAQLLPQQFVMNTVTGAWCSFSGWAPNCFITFGGQLYFGTAGGKVEQAWDPAGTIVNDNSVDITCTSQQAYNYFGSSQDLKKIDMMRFAMAIAGAVDLRFCIFSDFNIAGNLNFIPRGLGTPGSPWDTSPWDTSSWSPDFQSFRLWRAAAHAPGYALSLYLQTAGNTGSLAWAGTDYILDEGGMF